MQKIKLHVITHLFKSFPLQMNKESVPCFIRHYYVMMSEEGGGGSHITLNLSHHSVNTTQHLPPTHMTSHRHTLR